MEPTVTIAGLVGMLALVKSFVDYLRTTAAAIRNEVGARAALAHRTIAYVAGLAAVFLYGASQLGDFAIPGTRLLLSDMNGSTKVIVGLSIAGTASLVTDLIKARDNSDTAIVPSIMPPNPPAG